MNFLNPTAIAIAAGLTIPPLVALYFLKLKRVARPVPSTLLWKRAVEDLHVNAPFQRLRSSLLLLLQLLILVLAAITLGKPMLTVAQTPEDTVIVLIDQSASMGVVEADGRSRLDVAKEQAKRSISNMTDDARAMVIAFCDRATVVSSFDTDKAALMRKIDSIEQTQSTSQLGEAMGLAEAYTQNMIIGRVDEPDIEITATQTPATIFLFTDGRIEDAEHVALQKFDVEKMTVTNVGARSDNVGIVAMEARRHYERPEMLDVAATVQNFGPDPKTIDAVLYVAGQNVDVQSVRLEGAFDPKAAPGARPAGRPVGSVSVLAFDEIEYGGGGVVEVVLRVDDALPADDHAWTIIEEPRHLRVLLVTDGNLFLEDVLNTFNLELVMMAPAEYEDAEDSALSDGQRSLFDVVIVDRHSTARLPQGNYFFWGAVPQIEGVATGAVINSEVIFNWDDTHPILRHVATETLRVYEWLALELPPEAVPIIEGQTSPVLSYLTRDASQFLISAFSLIVEDQFGGASYNTYWVASLDFVVFMQNTIQYLAANVAATGRKSVSPGQPVTLPIPEGVREVTVKRPDGDEDTVASAGFQAIHYARTRRVGTYSVEPGTAGQDVFAVNLFNPSESDVKPAATVRIGAANVKAQAATVEVNEPAWPYLLIAVLVVLLFEWIIYNHRARV